MDCKNYWDITELSAERIELLKYLLKEEGIEFIQAQTICPRDKNNELLLSFAQQRLWFLEQFEPGNSTYHMPVAYRLKGSLNITALEQSLKQIVQRHEVLRTTFPSVDGQPSQALITHRALILPITDIRDHSETEKEAIALEIANHQTQQPFNLASDSLFRIKLLCFSDQEHILILNFHHIIFDGWSFNIFFQELETLYAAFSKGLPSPLPELPLAND